MTLCFLLLVFPFTCVSALWRLLLRLLLLLLLLLLAPLSYFFSSFLFLLLFPILAWFVLRHTEPDGCVPRVFADRLPFPAGRCGWHSAVSLRRGCSFESSTPLVQQTGQITPAFPPCVGQHVWRTERATLSLRCRRHPVAMQPVIDGPRSQARGHDGLSVCSSGTIREAQLEDWCNPTVMTCGGLV